MFKSGKLLLRATRREDLSRQWEFENDPEIWFLDGGTPRPSSLEKMLADFDQQSGKEGDDVDFAIEIDGNYVGHCSLHNFDETSRTCELSIEIGDRVYWGQGYGRSVVNLLLDYAFQHRNLHRVWLQTHSKNERAIRCYQACGFIEEGRLRRHLWLRGYYVDKVYMGVLQDERGETKE